MIAQDGFFVNTENFLTIHGDSRHRMACTSKIVEINLLVL
jgi:hypothetical protein